MKITHILNHLCLSKVYSFSMVEPLRVNLTCGYFSRKAAGNKDLSVLQKTVDLKNNLSFLLQNYGKSVTVQIWSC